MEFKKAIKTKQRLRLAVDGVSGSGKTFTALAVASGMGGPIALIDSEHGSASLYADRFEFDTLELMEFQIENYIEALNAAAEANYPIVIIDSTSHAWDALVARVERIANQKYGGNTFRAWGEGTPLQGKLIEAMLNYPGHVIVTCRSKTEYSVEKNEKGTTTIKKVGTAAVQRQGFEYEFTMAMTMDANHVGMVTKDRTGKFQDKFIEKPGKDFGKKLIEWLNEGAVLPPPPPPASTGTPPASEKTAGQQYTDTLTEIGNIMTSKFESGESVFSDEEKQKVKAQINAFPKNNPNERVKFIKWLLDEQKKVLVQRLQYFAMTHKVNEPPAADPPPQGEEEKPESGSTVPSMYDEPENPDELSPDGEQPFEDDIPDWDDKKEKPAKKGKKSTAKKAADKEPATAGASEELDIY